MKRSAPLTILAGCEPLDDDRPAVVIVGAAHDLGDNAARLTARKNRSHKATSDGQSHFRCALLTAEAIEMFGGGPLTQLLPHRK